MHVISSGVHELRDSCLLAWGILRLESSSLSGCYCSGWVFSGCYWPDMAWWWKEAPQKNFTAASPQVRIPELTHTIAHMHHTSHIMCVMTVWHPSIGNIIPILGYITLDTPITVVTFRELQNWNQVAKWNQNLAAVWGLSFFHSSNQVLGWLWQERDIVMLDWVWWSLLPCSSGQLCILYTGDQVC